MSDKDRELDDKTRILPNDNDVTRTYAEPRQDQVPEATVAKPKDSAESAKGNNEARVAIGALIANRFVLEQLLGQGGMSIVYRARDRVKERAGDPNPYVAIKILRADLSDNPDAVIALQRETKKAQMLAHPHIVTMHDFQSDPETGLAFAQMEELQGRSLRQIINSTPTGLADKEKAISIILGIADGLEYAHKRGIVHSDLKPSNVFVTETGQVKILDFGIARAMPGSDTDQFDAGTLGALTPAYATREMFDGMPPDPADDIYALGVIAHELLTGSHPYQDMLGHAEPAKVAHKLGLKPRRVKRLNRRQWHTLASSLAFERDSRPPDAGAFLRQFRRRSNASLYLGSVLLVISALLIYEWFTIDKLKPEIPFEDLPVATRVAFNKAIEEGDTAYKFKEFNGALHYYNEAHELHPYNPKAVAGLEKIVKTVMAQEHGESREQLERKLKSVQILLSYDIFAERSDLKNLEISLQESLAE